MKKSTYFITVTIMSILICLISGVLYVYGKDISTNNYSLNKINSNKIIAYNMNKEFTQNKKVTK